MYKINNLGETLSYMIRLDAYHQQSLFFSYKRTKQQTLRIMKINTDCGVIVQSLQISVVLHYSENSWQGMSTSVFYLPFLCVAQRLF